MSTFHAPPPVSPLWALTPILNSTGDCGRQSHSLRMGDHADHLVRGTAVREWLLGGGGGRVLVLLPLEGRWDGIDTRGKRSQLRV